MFVVCVVNVGRMTRIGEEESNVSDEMSAVEATEE